MYNNYVSQKDCDFGTIDVPLLQEKLLSMEGSEDPDAVVKLVEQQLVSHVCTSPCHQCISLSRLCVKMT